MMDENRLDNIVECSYNMDNGYVEVWYESYKKVVDKILL